MTTHHTFSTASRTFLGLAAVAALAGHARADVLDDVKAHGVLKCGVTLAAPGFSAEDNSGKRTGFDVDLCKAIAAATLGDDSKIQLVPMDLKTAFAGLPTGAVDVLTHRFTWTESRDIGGLKFPKVMFFDGQGFAVTTKSKANKVADLNNATICTAQGSTSELIVADYFRAHKLKYKIVTFASQEQAWDAFVGKRCDAAINDRSGLAARLAKLPNKNDFKVLTETLSNEPIGPIVAQGQPRWEAVVRFTLNALVAAEELGREPGQCRRSSAARKAPTCSGCWASPATSAPRWACPTTTPTRPSRRWATTATSGNATSAPRRRCAWSAAAMRWLPTAA